MELSQLEVFLAVARERRFSRAAEKLFRTQSAVSQTIRKLEEELGEALFDRSSRDGVLTDAGKVLYEYAEKLINLRGEAAESLSELRELQKGKLVIAANEFTVLYLLPVLAEFRRVHPMIKIIVERALGSHIPDDVLSYNVEFGVLSYEPQEENLHSVVVYLDELVFVRRRRRVAQELRGELTMHGASSVALEGEAAEVGEVLDERDVLGLCGGWRLSTGRESRDWGRDESCGGDACQDGAFHGGLLGLFGRFQGTLRWPWLAGR